MSLRPSPQRGPLRVGVMGRSTRDILGPRRGGPVAANGRPLARRLIWKEEFSATNSSTSFGEGEEPEGAAASVSVVSRPDYSTRLRRHTSSRLPTSAESKAGAFSGCLHSVSSEMPAAMRRSTSASAFRFSSSELNRVVDRWLPTIHLQRVGARRGFFFFSTATCPAILKP